MFERAKVFTAGEAILIICPEYYLKMKRLRHGVGHKMKDYAEEEQHYTHHTEDVPLPGFLYVGVPRFKSRKIGSFFGAHYKVRRAETDGHDQPYPVKGERRYSNDLYGQVEFHQSPLFSN